jgi:hypothetical protein
MSSPARTASLEGVPAVRRHWTDEVIHAIERGLRLGHPLAGCTRAPSPGTDRLPARSARTGQKSANLRPHCLVGGDRRIGSTRTRPQPERGSLRGGGNYAPRGGNGWRVRPANHTGASKGSRPGITWRSWGAPLVVAQWFPQPTTVHHNWVVRISGVGFDSLTEAPLSHHERARGSFRLVRVPQVYT